MNQNGPQSPQNDLVTWIAIGVLSLVVIYGVHDWFAGRHSQAPVQASRSVSEPIIVRSTSTPKPATAPETTAPTAAVAALTDDQIRTRFALGLRDLNKCLSLNTVISGDQVEPTTETLLEILKPELNEQVLQTDDSSSVDLMTPAGEHRRIRVEMDYSGADRIVRRVKYFKIGDNNLLEPIVLDPEASADPTETFLASLEEDGQVVGREKTQRVYFAGGEEVVISEKDGKIAELNMNRNGRTFHCRPLDPASPGCDCQ